MKVIKELWKEHQFFWELIIATIIILTIGFLAISCQEKFSKEKFENGCECGGHWEYQQAVGHQVTTGYIYKCDKCGNIVEFDNYYKEERED